MISIDLSKKVHTGYKNQNPRQIPKMKIQDKSNTNSKNQKSKTKSKNQNPGQIPKIKKPRQIQDKVPKSKSRTNQRQSPKIKIQDKSKIKS